MSRYLRFYSDEDDKPYAQPPRDVSDEAEDDNYAAASPFVKHSPTGIVTGKQRSLNNFNKQQHPDQRQNGRRVDEALVPSAWPNGPEFPIKRNKAGRPKGLPPRYVARSLIGPVIARDVPQKTVPTDQEDPDNEMEQQPIKRSKADEALVPSAWPKGPEFPIKRNKAGRPKGLPPRYVARSQGVIGRIGIKNTNRLLEDIQDSQYEHLADSTNPGQAAHSGEASYHGATMSNGDGLVTTRQEPDLLANVSRR
jgi:hypothetical protein